MNVEELCQNVGLNISEIAFKGEIERFQPKGRHDSSGWYVGFHNVDDSGNDYKVLIVGDWSKNEKHIGYSRSDLSRSETQKLNNKIKYNVRKVKKLKEKKQRIVSDEALNILSTKSTYLDVDSFEYLRKKHIKSMHGAMYINDIDSDSNRGPYIGVPVMDLEGKVWSIQKIYEDGEKRFLRGGKIEGNFFKIGEVKDVIYICEGFATGCSIHEVTSDCVVCAFNVSNLEKVYKSIMEKYSEKTIVICADNDAYGEKNVGLEKSEELRSKYGVPYALPMFKDTSSKPTDFNDLFVLEGGEAVRDALNKATLDTSEYNSNKLDREDLDQLIYFKTKGFYAEIEDDSGRVKEVPLYLQMAKYIKHIEHFKCDDSYKAFYHDGHYVFAGKSRLRNKILRLACEKASPSHIDQFYKMIEAYCHFEREDFKPKEGFINLANGVFEIDGGRLLSHDPSYHFTYKLNHRFAPEAECPSFMGSVRLVCENDPELMDLLQEIFGYVIEGAQPYAQKAFVFSGEGSNGKSTMIYALKQLLGSTNISTVPMNLLDKPFSVVSLNGKLANLVDETPRSGINAEAFKNIVTGGGVQASYKGRDEFTIYPFAKLIFACNKAPNFGDSSHGLRRRLIVFPFNATISDSFADVNIWSKIDNEMSGILNWAMIGLNRLKTNGYKFTQGEAVMAAFRDHKIETDSVYAFCSEHLTFSPLQSAFVPRESAYKNYKIYCKNNEFQVCGSMEFAYRFYSYCRDTMNENGMNFMNKHRVKKVSLEMASADKSLKPGKILRGVAHFTLENCLLN